MASAKTISPKQNAMCTTDGSPGLPKLVVDAIPIETKSNVPRNSAINMRHIFLFSVISCTPTISLTPGNIKNKVNVDIFVLLPERSMGSQMARFG